MTFVVSGRKEIDRLMIVKESDGQWAANMNTMDELNSMNNTEETPILNDVCRFHQIGLYIAAIVAAAECFIIVGLVIGLARKDHKRLKQAKNLLDQIVIQKNLTAAQSAPLIHTDQNQCGGQNISHTFHVQPTVQRSVSMDNGLSHSRNPALQVGASFTIGASGDWPQPPQPLAATVQMSRKNYPLPALPGGDYAEITDIDTGYMEPIPSPTKKK